MGSRLRLFVPPVAFTSAFCAGLRTDGYEDRDSDLRVSGDDSASSTVAESISPSRPSRACLVDGVGASSGPRKAVDGDLHGDVPTTRLPAPSEREILGSRRPTGWELRNRDHLRRSTASPCAGRDQESDLRAVRRVPGRRLIGRSTAPSPAHPSTGRRRNGPAESSSPSGTRASACRRPRIHPASPGVTTGTAFLAGANFTAPVLVHNSRLEVRNSSGTPCAGWTGPANTAGFFGAAQVGRQTVNGSWSDGTAGQSLAAALAAFGLIDNQTSA